MKRKHRIHCWEFGYCIHDNGLAHLRDRSTPPTHATVSILADDEDGAW